MSIYQKFGGSFVIALTLHLLILISFWLNVEPESELMKQPPLPEIIKASILDDKKIQQEVERLKNKTEQKRLTENKQQKNLENKLKKQQNLLKDAKKKRQQEEQKIRTLKKKQKQQVLKEQKRLKALDKQKVQDAARLARIKKKKLIEKKRADDLRKVEENNRELARQTEQKKRELARQAELKKQQDLLAEQQVKAAQIAADLKQQQDAKKVRQAKDKQATLSATAAIQQSVNNQWIRPLSSAKGLNCMVRVKLLPTGDVMDAQVIKGSGDAVFDRSAENAVRKASPLPVPTNRALFSKHFRSFTFKFNPS